MALSYYSNWDPDFDQSDSVTWNYDYFFDSNDIFLPLDDTLNFNSTAANDILEPFHYQKRQKTFEFEQFYSESHQYNFPLLSNPTPHFLQDYPLSELALPAPPPYKAGDGGGSVSAQSIAARQRRRKITEKTQELGKLVPGGQKMNTAEMLQSAYKYIKFLQAQVALLQFIQENAVECSEELQLLVESPLIQEKLSSSENCLAPQNFVRNENELNSSFVKKEH